MEITEERVLTSHDRCDLAGCNAQAYFLTLFMDGDLSWCLHHFKERESTLREISYHIIDQSDDLS